eukprot:COSAG01_NODE_157_length_23722_cov_85.712568_26_plen_494_part_00
MAPAHAGLKKAAAGRVERPHMSSSGAGAPPTPVAVPSATGGEEQARRAAAAAAAAVPVGEPSREPGTGWVESLTVCRRVPLIVDRGYWNPDQRRKIEVWEVLKDEAHLFPMRHPLLRDAPLRTAGHKILDKANAQVMHPPVLVRPQHGEHVEGKARRRLLSDRIELSEAGLRVVQQKRISPGYTKTGQGWSTEGTLWEMNFTCGGMTGCCDPPQMGWRVRHRPCALEVFFSMTLAQIHHTPQICRIVIHGRHTSNERTYPPFVHIKDRFLPGGFQPSGSAMLGYPMVGRHPVVPLLKRVAVEQRLAFALALSRVPGGLPQDLVTAIGEQLRTSVRPARRVENAAADAWEGPRVPAASRAAMTAAGSAGTFPGTPPDRAAMTAAGSAAAAPSIEEAGHDAGSAIDLVSQPAPAVSAVAPRDVVLGGAGKWGSASATGTDSPWWEHFLGRTAPTDYHRIVRKSQYNGVVRGRLLCSPPPPRPPRHARCPRPSMNT